MKDTKRTITCGKLNETYCNKTVVLNGWVHRIRKLGGLIFLILRDRYGMTQVVINENASTTLSNTVNTLKTEYCIAVCGTVKMRSDKDINHDMPTGAIEVVADDIFVFTKSQALPFPIDEVRQKDGTVVIPNEDLRLKYRYLDLRRAVMQHNIILRSAVMQETRQYLTEHNFLEIETPTFIKSTPEGARDYLVPSRVHPGEFYSLPQSPQLYKQLLMVAGFDRYFQIARCYRDEDARGDRQPEFTQIDMEMSFTNREEVLSTTEGLMQHIFNKTLDYKLPTVFDRLTWEDAINFYGTDKPDLRFDLQMQDASFIANLCDFEAFKIGASCSDSNLPRNKRSGLKALVVKGAASLYSRKKIEELEAVAKIYKAQGLGWTKVETDGNLSGGIAKFLTNCKDILCQKLKATPGDLLLFVSDKSWQIACTALGAVRKKLGQDLHLYNKEDEFHFVWIIDFPYFAWNEEENKWDTEHHMFTLPQEKYWATLETDTANVKGDLYDLVLNGYELASGSMRINDPDLQERIFEIVGYSKQRAQNAFGFLVTAFKYGAPPHGGIAPGLDRLLMLMCHEESIHEVIAFPKNNLAINPMDNSPSIVEQKQLDELYITIKDTQ